MRKISQLELMEWLESLEYELYDDIAHTYGDPEDHLYWTDVEKVSADRPPRILEKW